MKTARSRIAISRPRKGISLSTLLIAPFVLQVIGITSLVGYLSYRSGQQAVADLAHQLMAETGERVTQDLNSYLKTAHRLNQTNVAALQSGAISFDRLDQLQKYLFFQHQEFSEVTTVLLGTPQGEFRTIHRIRPAEVEAHLTQLQPTDLPYEAGRASVQDPDQLKLYAIDRAGNLTRYLDKIENIDVRERPWYRRAVATGKPGWSEPFQIGASNLLSLNAYHPVYGAGGQLEGVFSVNLSLDRLNDFLETLPLSHTGQVFIMERSGLLIANSEAELPYIISGTIETSDGASPPHAPQPGQLTFYRLGVGESSNPIMQAAYQQLQNAFSTLDQIQSSQELSANLVDARYFLHVTPYQDGYGLDWLIVTVVPQSDFTATIQSNVRRTVLLSGLALLGSIGLGIWIVRRVTRPLQRLNQATQAYALAKSPSPVITAGIQELDSLQQTFIQMMAELDSRRQEAETFHSNYARTLEQQVTEQTQRLWQTAAQLKEAQRIAQVGSWEFDVASGHVTWSEELFRIFGLPPDQPAPRYPEYLELLPSPDREVLKQAVEMAIARGLPYQVEHPIIRSDGTLRYIVGRGEVVLDDQGKVVKLAGTAADITQRKQAEAALKAKTEELNSFFSVAIDLLCIADTEGYFVRLNPQWEKTLGHRLEVLEGARFLDFVHPEDLSRTLDALKVLAYGQALANFVNRYRCADGSYRWIEWRSVPEGSFVYAAARDITERKRAEEALKESDRRFRAIFNTMFQFIGLLKPDGTLIEANQTALEFGGITRQDVLHRPFWEARWWTISADTQAQLQTAIAEAAAGQFIRYEVDVLGAGNRVTTIDFSLTPIRDEIGQVVLLIPEGRDISDRKRMESELQRAKEAAEAANQAKSRFIANISHELRSPLNAILGFARIIRGDQRLPSEHREHAEIIEHSGEHLLNIINQVLDLAKIEAKQTILNSSQVDLWQLLSDLKNLFGLKAEARDIDFVIERDAALPHYIQTDDMKLRQVLINLLDNAFKFTDQGQVSLTVRQLSSSDPSSLPLQFAIADTGPGIPPEEQALLFKPFSQTRSGQAVHSGTGLGLAISQEFVRLMGGTLSVSSQQGKGSTFQFDIVTQSIEPTMTLDTVHRRRVVGLQPGQSAYRILVVDDSPVNRRLLTHVLSVLKFEIEEAENGQVALEVWQSWQPHVVLIDLRMPVMDGYEAARYIRQQEKPTAATADSHQTLIVAVSATTGLKDGTQSNPPVDFDGYILKPFKSNDIFNTLQSLLGLQYRYDDDPS